jgi:hypothetical protein
MKAYHSNKKICILGAGFLSTMATLGMGVTPPVEPVVDITRPIPQSVFREMERDPFSPIGYVKPSPKGPSAKPVVDFKLKISGISITDGQASATLDDGTLLEVGNTYKFKDKDGKASASYKVLSIVEDAVTVLYDEKEHTFKFKGFDLESFQEKEESKKEESK